MPPIPPEQSQHYLDASRRLASFNVVLMVWSRTAQWLTVRIKPRDPSISRTRLITACSAIFLLAMGVRLLHRQDSLAETLQARRGMSAITRRYESEARRMLDRGGILFPPTPVDPGNARLILHPPGYSAFIAAIYAMLGESEAKVIFAQMALDSLSAIVVFLIAFELLNQKVALIAGALVALSPHFAHYSLWLSPDTLPILPILLAVCLVIRAQKRPHIAAVAVAGAMLGLSCWLRANGMLLAPFLAATVMILFERGKRIRYALALVATTILVISPITIRNWLLFHRFIPISVDSGLALIEGIGAYDAENRFDMPKFDGDALKKDVEWHGRPEYGGNLWEPDGVDRDEYRFRRGLDVIRANPAWFAGVMVRRATFMLRYDHSRAAVWPLTTATVPPVSAEPGFGHEVTSADWAHAFWSASAQDLIAGAVAPQAQARLSASGEVLTLISDESDYGDVFASAPIPVERSTDYVLALSSNLITGTAAVKVTTVDRRITLGWAILADERRRKPKQDDSAGRGGMDERVGSAAHVRTDVNVPFATGTHSEIILVISRNGPSASPSVLEIGQARIYDVGQTPHRWTRNVRPLVRGVQRNLYSTRTMVPIVIVGLALLLASRRYGTALLLLTVPAYYLLVHPVFHTEYRYILAIHYFLFSFAALTIYCAGSIMVQIARFAVCWAKRSAA